VLTVAACASCNCHVSQTIDLNNRAVAPSGRDSFNLILSAGTLTPGERYSFRLDVNTTSPSGKGLNEVVFLVNTVGSAAVRYVAFNSAHW